MSKKLLILSMDAMVGEDLRYLRTKPNYSRLMAHAAGVERAQTVYPSITYPAHVSIMTGCRAGKHGVYTNGAVKTTGGHMAWHLYSSAIQVEDIFAAAKRAGCTTAAVYWPVTGCNPNIDYEIDEFFFYDKEPVEETFRKLGANDAAIEVVRKNMDRYPTDRNGTPDKHHRDAQTFDNFIMGCVCTMLRDLKPDVLLAHNCILDSLRHHNGVFHENVREGLDRIDLWLGEVLQALEEAGTLEDTNVVILSDHGQRNFARRMKLNVLLRRGGFIDVDENGVITDYRAFSQSNGMSVYVFLKDSGDEAVKKQVYDYLTNLAADGVYGFSAIHTEAEVREKYGLYGDFAFILESDDGCTGFGDDWNEPLLGAINLNDYRTGVATHGYEPEKGPQPVFEAKGPDFRPDAHIAAAFTIDEAPTLAAVLGQTMPQAEGRVMTELLK